MLCEDGRVTNPEVLCEHCLKPFRSNLIPRHSRGCLGTSPTIERLYEVGAVEEQGECLLWTRATNTDGYALLTPSARKQIGERLGSRAAWTIVNGPIPQGLNVCHTCDNPPCVRIEHLFVGTHQDNMEDMMQKGRGSKPPVIVATKEWLNCPICEKSFSRTVGAKYPRTCSRTCGNALRSRDRTGRVLGPRKNAWVDRVCAVCGKVDQVIRSVAKHNPTCSPQCGHRYAWRSRQKMGG